MRGNLAIITTDKERDAAQKAGQEPISIGIPLEDVIKVLERGKAAKP